MSDQPFVHLHFHTAYSLLDGACMVKKAMQQAVELGMDTVAMTDHGVLFGTIEFYKEAQAHKIKPIIGCETYVAVKSRKDRIAADGAGNHFVLLAENETGYANLVRLISLAHLEGFYYKPRIDKELLAQYHEGLIGLSACLKGEVAECLLAGGVKAAAAVAGQFADIMGKDHFYLELEDHGMPEQRQVNNLMLELAKYTGLPLVATNDVHYIKREHAEAHDIMLCLQTQTTVSDPRRMRYASDQFYMKSAAEMWAQFGAVPEALRNTRAIADRCNVKLEFGEATHFPTFKLPDKKMSQKDYLIQGAAAGLKKHYGIADPRQPADAREQKICDRFFFELGVIEKTKFINYFLVVADFIQHAKAQNIPVGPGRGSGAGSLVAYALGITGIDPLRYNLIFERFLNPERVSPPDFDIDFCQARRGEVIAYVKEHYGKENVAQIITFGTLGPKTVVRDVGRALELPLVDCDRLAKMIPEKPDMTLAKAMEESPDFKRAVETEPLAQQIMKYATVLEGLPRQQGTHAAGVVIGEKPLIEILPLAMDKNGETITQFEMKPLESTGLLKMDFLGLQTLTIIQETINNVLQARGNTVDIDTIPMDDAETYQLLNRGDTVAVFQLESTGMRDLLRRIGISCIEDLIAMIALYRPGPMKMLDDYVNRKHGKVIITYDHPLLEGILKETYGIMLYQEQVQQAAHVLAGFSLGQGDLLRRAMGKKLPEEMAKQRTKFVEGCHKANHIPKEKAEKIFDNIERFAGYGFNKSHSAAYGVISYQTAYLKAHYPKEFMAAVMSMEMGNAEKLAEFIHETQEMDLKILPPDVNESGVRFTPVKDGIRFGLAGVKNVGAGAVEALVADRRRNGPFKGLLDFCARVDPKLVNRKAMESLVKCGAFDFTDISRGRLFAGIDFAVNRVAAQQDDRRRGQATLFDLLTPQDASDTQDNLPLAPPWPEHEMLSAEKELLGFYISGHPLTRHEWALNHFALFRMAGIDQVAHDALTRVGGVVTSLERAFSKNQKPYARFRLEGLENAVQVMVFSRKLEEFGALLREEEALLICGQMDRRTAPTLLAEEIYLLEQAHLFFAKCVHVHVSAHGPDDGLLEKARAVIQAHPGPTPVRLCVQFPGGEKVFLSTGQQFQVAADQALVHELQHILGEQSVYVEAHQQPCRRPREPRYPRNGGNGNGNGYSR